MNTTYGPDMTDFAPWITHVASADSVRLSTLVDRLDRLGDDKMREVNAALGVAVDCGEVG